jgi:acetyltransferase-like isoleucine patch superfamily enzyme
MTLELRQMVYPNVTLGASAELGPFVVLGYPAGSDAPGARATIIGDGARIRASTVIYAGNRIGHRFQTGQLVSIREDNEIGDDVSIGTGSVIEHHVRIGNRVRIHSQVFVPEHSVLEDDAWLGPNVVVTNVFHPLCPQAKNCAKGATIRRGAKIGANATLLPDITIGAMALVGAGSVVVRDVPDGAVVSGNPARVVKHIDELGCPYNLVERPYAALK